ncbi:MAG: alpha/beta fold hydrolase [bacterium]|nr:alpha/beta fold hydrolase [bacterium]
MKTSIIVLIVLIITSLNLSFTFDNSTSKKEFVQQEQFEPEGSWGGILKISSAKLKVIFNVSKNVSGNLTATLDSPDQGAYGIAVNEVIVKDDSIKFIIRLINGYYEGKYISDSMMISGVWNQAGMSLPLELKKSEKVEQPKRPQEPKEPFPYNSEEVKFINPETGNTLAGTLTQPEGVGPFTAVILVSGSGPQNRDEELLGHKPFLVLADYLTRRGIAVLRYDDRGIGESTGDFRSATSEDFAQDALAAVAFLKTKNEIDKIGIAGHSEGGLIAPMAAVQSEDVDFIVLMAGPGLRGDSILMLQTELIMKANGESEEFIQRDLKVYRKIYNEILSEKSDEELKASLTSILTAAYDLLSEKEKEDAGDKEMFIDGQIKIMLGPWFRYFINYDPYPTLKEVKCPVLAINGEKDLQVPSKENLSAIEQALKEGGNKNYKIVEMPGLNHLFQKSKTGAPIEYGNIEETFSEDAMKIIADWINQEMKKVD